MTEKNIEPKEEEDMIKVEKTENINTDEPGENKQTEKQEKTCENKQEEKNTFNYEVYGREVKDEAKKAADAILGDILSNIKTKHTEINKTIEDIRSNRPASDVFTTQNDLYIKVDLPRVTKEDIDIKISTDALEVDVNFPEDLKEFEDGESFKIIKKNRCSGKTKTVVPLPEEVDINKVKAEFKDNVLTITVPKIKGRKVDVEIA